MREKQERKLEQRRLGEELKAKAKNSSPEEQELRLQVSSSWHFVAMMIYNKSSVFSRPHSH